MYSLWIIGACVVSRIVSSRLPLVACRFERLRSKYLTSMFAADTNLTYPGVSHKNQNVRITQVFVRCGTLRRMLDAKTLSVILKFILFPCKFISSAPPSPPSWKSNRSGGGCLRTLKTRFGRGWVGWTFTRKYIPILLLFGCPLGDCMMFWNLNKPFWIAEGASDINLQENTPFARPSCGACWHTGVKTEPPVIWQMTNQ